MITLTDFITYDEVRSTVGMSTDTLPDTVISLELYANTLDLALDSLTIAQASLNPIKTVFPGLDPTTDSTPYNLTRLFSIYTVALEVAVSLSMRAPKTLSDSKVTIGRFSPEATWQDVIKEIKLKLGQLRNDLEGIGATVTDEEMPLLTAVKPLVDPVTGT